MRGDCQKMFEALRAKYVRHHDAALLNPGYALIDVSRLFPMFRLDHNDPENYDFKATDDYLSAIPKDMIIEFRLGESIEHSENRYRTLPPADYEKWAEIGVNIIRHYTEGWADGMHLNIQYVSVSEEPNDGFDKIFAGPYDEYLKLYGITYKKLRAAFPNMKIGGPATGYLYQTEACERFLAFSRANNIKPDFISGDIYTRDIDFMPEKIKEIENMLKSYGYDDTEIFITEMHLCPKSWRPLDMTGFEGAENAAFTATSLIRLMDTKLEATYFYYWGSGVWGLYVKKQGGERPIPVYYGLKFFTSIVLDTERIEINSSEHNGNIAMLSGITPEGNVQLLLSCYDVEETEFEISVPDYGNAKIKKIVDDGVEFTDEWEAFDKKGDNFKIELANQESGVYYIEFLK